MEKRVKALQTYMADEGLQAYLVTSHFNLRYISGFTGTNGHALITQDKAYFMTDFRYRQQALAQCEGFEVVIVGGAANSSSLLRYVETVIEESGLSNIGYEEEHVTVAQFDDIESILAIDLVPASGMIEALRQVKDEDEIALIMRACEIADAAFNYILDKIKPGVREIDIANQLDFHMRSLGASGVSFDTIVASGERSAMPHGVASEKLIAAGDFVTLDFGCYYQGYVSDITRTVSIGEPDPRLAEIYQIVYEANKRVTQLAKAGLTGIEMDAIARDYITANGYGEQFGHSLGHSFGLDIHEAPNASMHNKLPFKAGNVITNEPGIYLEGIGGVRIEDDLLLTETGNYLLTHSPRELIIL